MTQQMCSQCGRLVAPNGVEYINRRTGVVSTGRTGTVFLVSCTLSAFGLASVPVLDATLWHYAADGFPTRAFLAMVGLSAIILLFLVLTIRNVMLERNADLIYRLNYECHGCRQRWNWRMDQPYGVEYVTVAATTHAQRRRRNATFVRWDLEDVAPHRGVRSKV